jgi:hypothetical protein
MSENLMAASHQWATRPADERFENLADMYAATLQSTNNARTKDATIGKLVAVEQDGDVQIDTPDGRLSFNNWSFNQFTTRIGAPGSYLASLPAPIAVDAINVGIKRNKDVDAKLWYDDTTKVARAITSQSYARIHNHEVIKALMDLPGHWTTPPARPAKADQPGSRIATEEDCKSSTLIKPGDLIAPAGLYAGDRDMFAFMVDPETRFDDGSDGGLSRGFFAKNSEVGSSTFEIVTFLYRYICGNHIVWGAEKVESLSVKHIGSKARQRAFDKLAIGLTTYAQSSAKDDVARITTARSKDLADSYDDLLNLVFGQKKLLAKNEVHDAYELANQYADIDGSPRSVWGFANGVTRLSQLTPFADKRNKLDRAAGLILDLAASN